MKNIRGTCAVTLICFTMGQVPLAALAGEEGFEENAFYDFGGGKVVVQQGDDVMACPAPPMTDPYDANKPVCNASVDGVEQVSDDVGDLNSQMDEIIPGNKEPAECTNSAFGDPNMTDEEVAKLKEDLLKDCNTRFKQHKRRFAWQLLKHGKPFKALKVALRKKKKLEDLKSTKVSKTAYGDGKTYDEADKELKAAEQQAMTELMNELKGGDASSGQSEKKNDKFIKSEYKLNYTGRVNSPVVKITTPDGGGCSLKMGELNIPDPVLPPKGLQPPADLKKGFADDCAIMISDSFSEAQAMKLMGYSDRTKVCGKKQKFEPKVDPATGEVIDPKIEGKKTLDQLDAIAKQFVDAAESGLKPNFKINVSRNQYADTVVPLAQKRGEFMQKYLEMKIQEELKARGQSNPEWYSEKSGLSKDVLKVEIPEYEGNTKEQYGDFGADPLAKGPDQQQKQNNQLGTDQQKEINELKVTMEKRQVEYDKQIADYEAQNAKLNELVNGPDPKKKYPAGEKPPVSLNQQILDLENQIKELNGKTVGSPAEMKATQELVNSLVGKVYELKYQRAKYQRDMNYNASMITTVKERKVKHDPVVLTKQLSNFYADCNTKGVAGKFDQEIKDKYEKDLWSNFKMAVVEGSFEGEGLKDDEIDYNDLSPEMQYALESNVEIENFSCDYRMGAAKGLRWQKGKKKYWKSLVNGVTIGAAWTISTPFIGLIAVGKGIGKVFKKKNNCPSWSSWQPYKKIRRTVQPFKNAPAGSYGNFHMKPVEFYKGEYDDNVWPEAAAMFDGR